ncbi:MAG: SAM-dependent methyltransferase [Bryobacteraceae bacterium]
MTKVSVQRSRAREYFTRLYLDHEDPWNFESSQYEAKKYEASVRALPRRRYLNAFEIGCSIGVFTAKLAPRCRKLLSVDLAFSALEKARKRCREYPHVDFELMAVPEEYPTGMFDLTVLSEVAVYLEPQDLRTLSKRITEQTTAGGHLLLVHCLGEIPDYPLRGDDVHEHFLTLSGWNSVLQSRGDGYRIDVLERSNWKSDHLVKTKTQK